MYERFKDVLAAGTKENLKHVFIAGSAVGR